MGFLRSDAQSDPTFATTMKQHARKVAQPSPAKHEKQLGREFALGIDTKKRKKDLLGGKKLPSHNPTQGSDGSQDTSILIAHFPFLKIRC